MKLLCIVDAGDGSEAVARREESKHLEQLTHRVCAPRWQRHVVCTPRVVYAVWSVFGRLRVSARALLEL